jgi:hypothetical protein
MKNLKNMFVFNFAKNKDIDKNKDINKNIDKNKDIDKNIDKNKDIDKNIDKAIDKNSIINNNETIHKSKITSTKIKIKSNSKSTGKKIYKINISKTNNKTNISKQPISTIQQIKPDLKKEYILSKNIIYNLLDEYCKLKKKNCFKIINVPNKKLIKTKKNLKKTKKIKKFM